MDETEKDKRPALKVYSWNLSATNDWDPETELPQLRDNSPKELVEWINQEPDTHVQCSAIMELIRHGCLRKAAELARAFIEADPTDEEPIISNFAQPVGVFLLKMPLENIPLDPMEFNPNSRIEYIEK